MKFPTTLQPLLLSFVACASTLSAKATETPLSPFPEVRFSASIPEPTQGDAAGHTLLEERPADETGRPDWTSSRRFSTTRVYLQTAPGEVGFEQWLRLRDYKDGTSQARFYEEIEIGLPYRFQLDIYEKWVSDEHRRAHHDETSFEIRWAPANWNKIPLNPTFYLEWAQVDHDANALESKILLGQDLTPRVHFGANFVWERGLSHDLTNSFQVDAGLSYTVIDQVVSVGAELEYTFENNRFDRNHYETSLLIGPSVQLRPTRNTHFDLVGLIGANEGAPNVEFYAIFGIEFGRIAGSGEKSEGYIPVASRSH